MNWHIKIFRFKLVCHFSKLLKCVFTLSLFKSKSITRFNYFIDDTFMTSPFTLWNITGLLLLLDFLDSFDFKCPILHLELNPAILGPAPKNYSLSSSGLSLALLVGEFETEEFSSLIIGTLLSLLTALCSNTGILIRIPCKCQYLAIFSKKLSLTLLSTSTQNGGCQLDGGLILQIPCSCATLLILAIYFNGSLNSSAVGSKTGASGGTLKTNLPFSIRLTGSINFPSGHSFCFGSSISNNIICIHIYLKKIIITYLNRYKNTFYKNLKLDRKKYRIYNILIIEHYKFKMNVALSIAKDCVTNDGRPSRISKMSRSPHSTPPLLPRCRG
ncbi:hypothetical protein AGLY_005024 [Aphis glycines]|uniref:Uncharacterized protein n=1 Tax=Aphis glycines TaxID=307491 RepID=A0A6G0TVL9_APHGL|nr:hypothetical protein AGLY_005024 [Aphis glycines]